jgi:cell cycle checkpoint protein
MSRRRSSRKAADVMDLVSSSDEEDEQQRQRQKQRLLQNGGGARERGDQLPKSIPSSPVSPATTTSNNPLANLLAAASSKPPSARPPPARKATKPQAEKKKPTAGGGIAARGGAAKRKNARGRETIEDDDLDFIESPPPPHATVTTTGTAAANGRAGGGSGTCTEGEMWSLKYEPRTPEDLIVHKKKVDEVKLWLQIQLHAAGHTAAPGHSKRLLVVTGPPGCGKTATLRVLSESLGFSITEWQAQAEASYQEINYLNNTNNTTNRYEDRLGYVSKIAAFENFTSQAIMPALPLSTFSANKHSTKSIPALPPSHLPPSTTTAINGDDEDATTRALLHPAAGPVRPTIVFIDDLPFTSDPETRRRLASAVSDLAKCARFPVVMFVTEASGRAQHQDRYDNAAPGGLPKELASALDAIPGVATISLNPVTALNTAKCLREILKKENSSGGGTMLPEGQLKALAEQSGGDLRNAINSLQFACAGVKPAPLLQHADLTVGKQPAAKRQKGAAAAAAKTKTRKEKVQVTETDVDNVAFMLRDTSLGLFHGLGKLLYNKRRPYEPREDGEEEEDEASQPAAAPPPSGLRQVPCLDFFKRPPMDGFNNPDDVLTAAGLEATSVNAFLQENIPHFIQDASIFDLAMCLSQLSTSDVLSSAGKRQMNDLLGAGEDAPGGNTIADSCAAMVAARGVCFWNTHPAPRQWQPLKGPALYAVQRGIHANSEQLHEASGVGRVVYGGSGGLDTPSLLATEILPAVRAVCQNIRQPYTAPASLVYQQPAKWTRFWQGKLHETVMHAGVGGRGTVVELDTTETTRKGGGGGGGGGGGVAIEEDPIEDSDDDF